jgi:hypothetical protein
MRCARVKRRGRGGRTARVPLPHGAFIDALGCDRDGQELAARGIAVHLFVRSQKKRAGGGAAPFVYCEDVWRGEKPITVEWKVPEAVPARLRGDLGVPDDAGQG